ncbi:MAG: SGNH/GDSL hydrolase family protein [Candidatus Omnitrophica bacterium]|nr:SGNH/GDSL hydrolase family protein [Candidatus Omnitrophota bacterium]
MKKHILFIPFLIIIVVISVILIGEVGTVFYRTLSGKGGYIWIPDYYLGVVHAPNSRFTYVERYSKEFSVKRKTNSLGLVGEEISLEKPENVFRILVLGDSFTEGLHVDEGKNFCERLEYLLNKDQIIRDFEVINAGMSGYSPIAEYLFLKRELLKLKPDLIILQLFPNDVFEDNKTGAMSVLNQDGFPIKINKFFIDRYYNNPDCFNGVMQKELLYKWHKFIISKSMFLQSFARASKKFHKKSSFHLAMTELPEYDDRHQFFIVQGYNTLFKDVKFREKALSNTRKYILRIKDLAEKNNDRFFMFCIPPEGQLNVDHLNDYYSYFPKAANHYFNKRLKQLSRRNAIDYLDLRAVLNKNKDKDLYYKEDGHLKEIGHSIVAEELFKRIKIR